MSLRLNLAGLNLTDLCVPLSCAKQSFAKQSYAKLFDARSAALGVCLLASATPLTSLAGIYDEGSTQPTLGWRILQDDFEKDTGIDIVSFEWDYFMIHNRDGRFNGIVGYVVANPREHLKHFIEIVPNGGNMAVVAEIDGKTPVSNYSNFGFENSTYSKTERYLAANDPRTGQYALIEPAFGQGPLLEPALHLTGRSADFEWDLIVKQDWQERDSARTMHDAAFTVAHGNDVGIFKTEKWAVDAIWPRTDVQGTMKVLATNEVIDIDAKGYREDSWGTWLLSIDGWDFMVFSEFEDQGVLMSMQTYHRSQSMDFLDVSFYDKGELVAARFRPADGQLGWNHPQWKWDARAKQCVPQNTEIVAQNDIYRIEAHVDIGSRQVPILSNKTIGTRIYFIQEHFPHVTGVIRNIQTGEVVKEFSGQAGGEFSFTKKLLGGARTDAQCKTWGDRKFSHPLPEAAL